MRFEWNKTKNHLNFAKHGVDFSDVVAVFEDGLALTRPDPDAADEARFVTLGLDGLGRLAVVVFAERDDIIRIISARLAGRQERKTYESGI